MSNFSCICIIIFIKLIFDVFCTTKLLKNIVQVLKKDVGFVESKKRVRVFIVTEKYGSYQHDILAVCFKDILLLLIPVDYCFHIRSINTSSIICSSEKYHAKKLTETIFLNQFHANLQK